MAEIRVVHAEAIEKLFEKTPKEARIIMWRALNRAGTAAKTRASVSIRSKYVIKAADVKRKIKLRKASVNRLSAQINASGPVTPLMSFDVTPTFPDVMQVRARVKKGAKKPIQSGFVTRVGNGHVNVFTRVGKSRYPIKALYGPSVAQMMGNEEIVKSIEKRAQEVLNKRLEHDLDRLLRGVFS